MNCKFLFGKSLVFQKDKKDLPQFTKYSNTILLMTDDPILRYRDIATMHWVIPITGGLVTNIGFPGKEIFTDDPNVKPVEISKPTLEEYRYLVKEGSWFRHIWARNKENLYTVFCCVERGFIPSSIDTRFIWNPVNYSDIKE